MKKNNVFFTGIHHRKHYNVGKDAVYLIVRYITNMVIFIIFFNFLINRAETVL
jgi:hypothetical protein